MYRVYVKENGVYHLVEAFEEKEKVYSKIDEYIGEYEEVIILKELNYVMGKIREKAKVLKK